MGHYFSRLVRQNNTSNVPAVVVSPCVAGEEKIRRRSGVQSPSGHVPESGANTEDDGEVTKKAGVDNASVKIDTFIDRVDAINKVWDQSICIFVVICTPIVGVSLYYGARALIKHLESA